MDVSVILVNYNTANLTKACLKSVFDHTSGIDFEVYVVDNASTDNSCEIIETEFPQVILIRNTENLGFGKANNIAMKRSQAKYVFLLNTDTVLVNNAIKIFFDFMEKEENKNVAVCGGTLYDENNNPNITYGNFPSIGLYIFRFGLYKIFPQYYNKHFNLCISEEIKEPKEVDYVIGADFFARRDIMEEMNYFDEIFFMYMEEVDLCKRIKEKYSIKVIPEAAIIHINCGSTKPDIQRWKSQIASLFIYIRKYCPKPYVLLVKIIHILKYFCALILHPSLAQKYFTYIRLITKF